MPAHPEQEADLRLPSRPAVIVTLAVPARTSRRTGADSGAGSIAMS
ncbi:hypothetical protein [Nonomuraea jabiensis]